MIDGTSTMRTIVESTATATASPRPNILISGTGLATKLRNTAIMISAANAVVASGGAVKVSAWFLIISYLLQTFGELCISPVGLSMITKLAPLRLASLMMGVWFLVNLFGNTLAGYIGAFPEKMGPYPWMVSLAGDFGVRAEHAGLLGVFGGLAVVLLLFSVILWAISGRIVIWMHGAEKTTK